MTSSQIISHAMTASQIISHANDGITNYFSCNDGIVIWIPINFSMNNVIRIFVNAVGTRQQTISSVARAETSARSGFKFTLHMFGPGAYPRLTQSFLNFADCLSWLITVKFIDDPQRITVGVGSASASLFVLVHGTRLLLQGCDIQLKRLQQKMHF